VGAVYDLATGSVDWLGTHPEQGRLLAYTEGASTHDGAAKGSADTHATTATASHEPAAAKTEHGAAQPSATAATGATEPRLWRWILGTVVALLVAMGAAWYFARSIMTTWKVPQRIAAGFAMILLVLAGVGFAGYEGLHSALVGFTDFDTDSENTVLVSEIDVLVMESVIAAKDYEITRHATDIAEYQNEHTTLVGLTDKALKSIQEPARNQLVESIRKHMDEHASLFQQMTKATSAAARADLGKRLDVPAELATQEVKKLMADYVAEMAIVGPSTRLSMAEAQAAVISIAVGALVLGLFVAWLISNSIVAPLRGFAASLSAGSEQTAAAAGQVSGSAQTLAEGASEQAASLEETSASLEEITSMTKRNGESATQAKELATQTRAAADAGAAEMDQMKVAMDAIKLSSGEIAQRSAQAAKETATKIEDSVTKSEHGVRISAKVALSLQQIVERARKVDAIVAEIATASNEQTQGIGQVNTAVSQMDQVTQSNAAVAEEAAAAAEELNAQSEELKRVVNELGSLIGAVNGSAAPASGRPTSSHLAMAPKRAPAKPARIQKRLTPVVSRG
jgi:methyl-accepting chemotaxis protein